MSLCIAAGLIGFGYVLGICSVIIGICIAEKRTITRNSK